MIHPVSWKTRLDILSDAEVRLVHEATLRVLQRTGVVMPLQPARREQAQDLGLTVDTVTDRIQFPPEIIEQTLQRVPSHFTLFARDPANDLELDGKHGYLTLDGCGTDVLDLNSGLIRPSTKADLESAAKLADALPQIAFLWPIVSAREQPARVQPLHELEALLLNSSKHVQAMTAVDGLNAQGSVEIAAEIMGGKDALRKRPILSNFQCSVSPLSYDAKSLEAAFVFGEAGIPTGFMDMTIGCATAPATVAGNAVVANTEVLAGIVLFELFYPGVPTFYGSCATMMELHSGGVTSGGVEDYQLQAIACQMARFYNLPSNIGTFASGSKAIGWQSGVDNALSGMISQLAGADMMCGAGLLYGARILS